MQLTTVVRLIWWILLDIRNHSGFEHTFPRKISLIRQFLDMFIFPNFKQEPSAKIKVQTRKCPNISIIRPILNMQNLE